MSCLHEVYLTNYHLYIDGYVLSNIYYFFCRLLLFTVAKVLAVD